MFKTWGAVAQVRGEWKRSALGPVKELYFKDFPLPDQWRERQAFAKWLLADNADKTDAFVFDGIEYSEVRHISATVCATLSYFPILDLSWLGYDDLIPVLGM